jgi:hypothetical protein
MPFADGTVTLPMYTRSTAQHSPIEAPDIEVDTENACGASFVDKDRRSGPFAKLAAWFRS